MRIQELVGQSIASGVAKHLKQMVMQPTKVQYNADNKRYELRSDDFIINLIAWRSRIRGANPAVHPISMLGLYTTPRLIGALFSNKGFIDSIRTFDSQARPGSDDNPDAYKCYDAMHMVQINNICQWSLHDLIKALFEHLLIMRFVYSIHLWLRKT